MSDHFDKKDYSDYFSQLESRLHSENKTKAPETVPLHTVKTKRGKGFFKVISLSNIYPLIGIFVAVIIGILLIVSFRSCSKDKKKLSEKSEASPVKHSEIIKEDNADSIIEFTADENTKDLPADNDAKNGIVIRLSDNRIMAQRNCHEEVFPASTTKIMTLLTAAENITDMNDTFTMTYAVTDPLYRNEATLAGFMNNEKVSMTDLLYGTILPSGADAAMGLALKISGSEKAFTELMNKKADELGLKNTHFSNPTGLHSKDNYTSAYDLAVILSSAMKNDLCRKILSTYQYTTASTPEHPDGIPLSSTLFSYMYGTEPETAVIKGGKTGFVNESGYCIASFGNNLDETEEYVAVTLGNSSRWPAFFGQINLYKEFAK